MFYFILLYIMFSIENLWGTIKFNTGMEKFFLYIYIW